MKMWIRLSAGVAAGIILWSGTALGQEKSAGCEKAGAPAKVEGQVVKVDPVQGKVTVRGADGTTHVFEASKETLQDFKEGDQIKAKLRSAPGCK